MLSNNNNNNNEWKHLVILLASSVNAFGKSSKVAHRTKNTLLLSSQRVGENENLFCVLKRKDLENKGGKDPKTLAAAFKQLIKQDRIKGLAQKQKQNSGRKVKKNKQQQNQEEEEEGGGDDETMSQMTDTTASTTNVQKSFKVEHTRESLIELSIQNELKVDETIKLAPSEEDIQVAREVLSISDEEAKPDKIYVLSDYPSTIEEASCLISSNSGGCDSIFDAVIQVMGKEHDEPYTAPMRTSSQISQVSVDGAKSMVTFSPELDEEREEEMDGKNNNNNHNNNNNNNSMHSLPNIKLAKFLLQEEQEEDIMINQQQPNSMLVSKSKIAMRDALAYPYVDGSSIPENNFVELLRKARAHAQIPGWKDLVFLELPAVPFDSSQDPEDFKPLKMLEKFCKLVYDVSKERYRFLKFLSSCNHVHIPKTTGLYDNSNGIEMQSLYQEKLKKVSKRETLRTVAVVLDCICETIAESLGENYPIENQDDSNIITTNINYGDKTSICRLARDSAFSSPEELNKVKSIERKYWQSVQTPGGKCRQWMPRWPKMDDIERGLEETQFQSLISDHLEKERVDHIRAIVGFENLMQKADPHGSRDRDYSNLIYCREFNVDTISQVIGNLMCSEPKVFTQYVDKKDKLLVGLHRPTPVGRQCKITRSAFEYTNLRPTFSEWPTQDLRERPCVYNVDIDPIAKLEQHCHCIFPCDKSLIRLESIPSRKISWCSVEKDEHLFGLRNINHDKHKLSCFYANFNDETTLVIERGPECLGKPDKHATVFSTYTCPNGYMVQHYSNGSIRIFHIDDDTKCERLILGSGTIVCFSKTGEKTHILFPNGDVWKLIEGGTEYDRSSFFGGQYDNNNNNNNNNEEKPEFYLDPETHATILKRRSHDSQGETIFISHVDGTVLVEHADGTRILTQPNDQVIRIEGPHSEEGYPSIKIFTNIETTAAKHSRGGRVDISRGGKNIRSSTLFPDATMVHIEYDTRVTADVNGTLRIIKADGTVIEAGDDGKIVWRPWDVDTQQKEQRKKIEQLEEEKALHPDAREEPNRNLGCFIFNCDEASLDVTDWENNIFSLKKLTSIDERKIDIDLAGGFDNVNAIINQPIHPRLFMMDGKGNGVEFISRDSWELDIKRMERFYRNKFKSLSCSSSSTSSSSLEKQRSPPVYVQGLHISSNLEQLRITDRFVPSILEQERLIKHVSNNKMQNSSFENQSSLDWILIDKIRQCEPITREERAVLEDADQRYNNWQREIKAQEDRYNVDDNRHVNCIDEERKLQLYILREKKKIKKAERKKNKKLSTGKSFASSSYASSTSSLNMNQRFNQEVGLLSNENSFYHGNTTTRTTGILMEEIQDEEEEGDIDQDLDESISLEEMEEKDENKTIHKPIRPSTPKLRHETISDGINFWDK